MRRFYSLQRIIKSNEELKTEYHKVMREYIDLYHMTLISDSITETSDGYIMPHHDIIKSSSHTTKVRVVFDASAKSELGISLNDALLVGSTIQDKLLFEHLLRFRTHVYVSTADIEKMYK